MTLFFNTYLDHRSQYSRERSAMLITKRISQRENKDPVVLTGDMNAREDNNVIKFYKIDYVFTQKSAQIIDVEVIRYNEKGGYLSDHCPVAVRLVFP